MQNWPHKEWQDAMYDQIATFIKDETWEIVLYSKWCEDSWINVGKDLGLFLQSRQIDNLSGSTEKSCP